MLFTYQWEICTNVLDKMLSPKFLHNIIEFRFFAQNVNDYSPRNLYMFKFAIHYHLSSNITCSLWTEYVECIFGVFCVPLLYCMCSLFISSQCLHYSYKFSALEFWLQGTEHRFTGLLEDEISGETRKKASMRYDDESDWGDEVWDITKMQGNASRATD